jgi:hypothetical protein
MTVNPGAGCSVTARPTVSEPSSLWFFANQSPAGLCDENHVDEQQLLTFSPLHFET